MTLRNLLKTGQLKERPADVAEIRQRGRTLVLDALRRKRNLSDYTGEDIDDVSADGCAQEAERLLGDVAAWMAKNHPELMS